MSYYENRIKALEAKVAEMARMQRHKVIPVEAKLVERIAEYQAENARLKAEVERLKMEESKLLTLCETYEGDLERLRKAGDEVVSRIQVCTEDLWCSIHRWNAASEGKQP